MTLRKLGELEVSALGLGCMGMSEFYGPTDEREAIATIHRSVELGITLLDTADMYGPFTNEELVGRAIRGRRNAVTLATKYGIVRDERGGFGGINGRPEYVQRACEASLRRLRVDTIDLYQLHRPDPNVAIEESVGAMARLVEQGKVRQIGLSEVGPKTLRRGHAEHPITSLQTEYSLLTRDAEQDVLPTCEELGIGFLAYSPLGRGFLTGRYRSAEDFGAGDTRPVFFERFASDAMEANLSLLARISDVAEDLGHSLAQLALAWVLAKGDFIVPIPGTKSRKRLEENAAAVRLHLSPEHVSALDQACPVGATQGARYPEGMVPVWD